MNAQVLLLDILQKMYIGRALLLLLSIASPVFCGTIDRPIPTKTPINVCCRLPGDFDIEAVGMAYPTSYHESMNTVLVQELQRYNNLTAVMRRTLKEVNTAVPCGQQGYRSCKVRAVQR